MVKRGLLYLQEDGSLGPEPCPFTLAKGASRVFSRVPAGIYTVTEQDASVEGYTWEVTGGMRNGDNTFSLPAIVTGEDDAAEAAFINRYTKIENGSLHVSKQVVGGPDEAASKDYSIEITTDRHDQTMWLRADGKLTEEKTTLSLSQDHPLSFATVPAGIYTIEEDQEDAAFSDYALQVEYPEGKTVTVHKDTGTDLSVKNSYTYLYAPVLITKTVTGNLADKSLNFGFDIYVRDKNNQPIIVEGVTDQRGMIQFSLKDGQEKLLEKLPKGAVLTIVEHNVHYDTSVEGWIGIGDRKSLQPLSASETHSDIGMDTTETYSFTIPDEGACVDFTNDYNMEKSVILKKAGYDNQDERIWDLPGAVFRIYEDERKTKVVELDGKTEFTSDDDGVFYSGPLGIGTYYLDEITVPEGYLAPGGMYVLRVEKDKITLTFTATSGRPDLNDWISLGEGPDGVCTVSIRNTRGYELPSTGGPGRNIFCLTGLLLVLLAGVGFSVSSLIRKGD